MRFTLNGVETFLRTGMLVLLVAGLFLRPVLNHVGSLHEVGHAAAAEQLHHDHGHDHDHDAGSDADDDHVAGGHALLHQADAASSAGILICFSRVLRVPSPTSEPLTALSVLHPTQRSASPFRPPIA